MRVPVDDVNAIGFTSHYLDSDGVAHEWKDLNDPTWCICGWSAGQDGVDRWFAHWQLVVGRDVARLPLPDDQASR
jgi:hypothetical protein